VVCCLAVTASIGIGLTFAIRKGASESSSQFFLAGRRLSWPLVGASLFATAPSTWWVCPEIRIVMDFLPER
jgi:Na+/proline symporter